VTPEDGSKGFDTYAFDITSRKKFFTWGESHTGKLARNAIRLLSNAAWTLPYENHASNATNRSDVRPA
jgi:hypothetical protein